MQPAPEVRSALDLLDKENVLFAIHAPSFPVSPGEDLGVGTPHSDAAHRLLEVLREQGYTGVLLGPEGRTTAANPSPYDSTWFSRSELLLGVAELVRSGALPRDVAETVAAMNTPGERADFALAHRRASWVIDRAWATRRPDDPAWTEFRARHGDWLESDGLHAVLGAIHRGAPWPTWPSRDREASPVGGPRSRERWRALVRIFGPRLERYAFGQWLVHEQRSAFRQRAHGLGLEIWGDLQIGPSPADAWRFRHLFLPGYALGAPPSRTNPEGQPWDYAVSHPDLEEQAYSEMLRPRIEHFAGSYDGLRIDHPHGWVCPWVYRSPSSDPHAAVRAGARLFESPALPDHPELARFARVRVDQLNPSPGVSRHADDWVANLDDEQIERYARAMTELVTPFRPARRARVASEVLSTQPRPLARVTERLELGRFRVTQKANPDDPHDVYRGDLASPRDWVMAGTHDTESLWSLAADWVGNERGRHEARYLAARLGASSAEEERMAKDGDALVHAKMADVFASPARNVIVFFADHFGIRERYNAPGTVGPQNWTLRVPARPTAGMDVRRVLALALAIRHPNPSEEIRALQVRLRAGSASTR